MKYIIKVKLLLEVFGDVKVITLIQIKHKGGK